MNDLKELMEQPSGWIWTADWDAKDKETPKLVYFRKVMTWQERPRTMVLHVSADTRYKLYVNGILAGIGPQKGDHEVWYYDTVDIAPFLRKGENVIAACVLRYPQQEGKGNYSMFRTDMPGFYLKQEDHLFMADRTWKVKKRHTCEIVSENVFFDPIQIFERVTGEEEFEKYRMPEFDDGSWENAVFYPEILVKKAVSPGNLHARTIPFMTQIPGAFREVSAVRNSVYKKYDWESFLRGERTLELEPYSHEIIELSAGEETTAYLNFACRKGSGSRCTFVYAESYYQKEREEQGIFHAGKKEDRTDAEGGELKGQKDEYTVSGYGNCKEPESYETFWFRTFRFVRIEIIVGKEPLILDKLNYRETGYPLQVVTHVQTSDPSLADIWKISERTLRCCMHETYEDCPYYEQLQYVMDSRSQMLYTYQVSCDDSLARNCMKDIKNSVRHDGMINSCYPQMGPNVIPGFSIYYIGMVYDHMMYFDDKKLILDHLPVIDGILRFFERNMDARGLVGKIGGLNVVEKYWSFIDWTPQWDATSGVPGEAAMAGAITMESLLYILGLTYAAALSEHVGRIGVAEEYRQRADRVRKAVNIYCRGKDGLYQDGPGVEAYSQHCQVFALLTDTVSAKEGRQLLEITLADPEKYAPCSVAMAFYLFRAMEKAGIYEQTRDQWNIWRKMLKNHCTTCVEDDVNSRSDCHAWGALALYELPAVILGVHPTEPGYRNFEICPNLGYLEWAQGEVMIPHGSVKVSVNREKIFVLTDAEGGILRWNGKKYFLKPGIEKVLPSVE